MPLGYKGLEPTILSAIALQLTQSSSLDPIKSSQLKTRSSSTRLTDLISVKNLPETLLQSWEVRIITSQLHIIKTTSTYSDDAAYDDDMDCMSSTTYTFERLVLINESEKSIIVPYAGGLDRNNKVVVSQNAETLSTKHPFFPEQEIELLAKNNLLTADYKVTLTGLNDQAVHTVKAALELNNKNANVNFNVAIFDPPGFLENCFDNAESNLIKTLIQNGKLTTFYTMPTAYTTGSYYRQIPGILIPIGDTSAQTKASEIAAYLCPRQTESHNIYEIEKWPDRHHLNQVYTAARNTTTGYEFVCTDYDGDQNAFYVKDKQLVVSLQAISASLQNFPDEDAKILRNFFNLREKIKNSEKCQILSKELPALILNYKLANNNGLEILKTQSQYTVYQFYCEFSAAKAQLLEAYQTLLSKYEKKSTSSKNSSSAALIGKEGDVEGLTFKSKVNVIGGDSKLGQTTLINGVARKVIFEGEVNIKGGVGSKKRKSSFEEPGRNASNGYTDLFASVNKTPKEQKTGNSLLLLTSEPENDCSLKLNPGEKPEGSSHTPLRFRK